MRLAAQSKLGFYPIPEPVITLILHHLKMPEERADKVCIIDPCCGAGDALKQLQDGLGVKPERTYAVELDGSRIPKAKENLQGSHVLGPCSFFGASITGFSFGLAYVNPPFDNIEGGGGREELSFLEKSTRLLVADGVLVFVCPLKTLTARGVMNHLEYNYDDLALYQFPDAHRKFKEVVVFGKRRGIEVITLPWSERYLYNRELGSSYRPRDPDVGSDNRTWTIPDSWAPTRFVKSDYLPEELMEVVEASPLARLLEPPGMPQAKRPPLPLNKGHRALLLASGMLDGVVEPEDEEPHVVRGSTTKVEYVSSRTESVDEGTGVVTKKTVISQRPVLTVRAVTQDGVIMTLSDEVNTEGDDEKDEPEDE